MHAITIKSKFLETDFGFVSYFLGVEISQILEFLFLRTHFSAIVEKVWCKTYDSFWRKVGSTKDAASKLFMIHSRTAHIFLKNHLREETSCIEIIRFILEEIACEETSVGVERKQRKSASIAVNSYRWSQSETRDQVLACQNKETTKILFFSMVHKTVYPSTVHVKLSRSF